MDTKKGNTDCLYFLASPLTCTKGMECEFRHSEVARLNPRDCYYWLAGNCLNPTCSFRHPPLERPETSSEPATVLQHSSLPATVPQHSSLPATVPQHSSVPATVPQHSSVPSTVPQHSCMLVSKVSVPCYFYFNGFCNKGDNCTFMHGPSDVSAIVKVPKKIPTVNNIHPLERKTSTESIKVQPFIEALSNSVRSNTSNSALKVQFRPQGVASQPAESKVLERSSSLQASVPGCEKSNSVRSNTSKSALKVQFRPQEVALQPVESKVLERSSSLQASVPGCEKSNSIRSKTSKSALKVQFRPQEVALQPVESKVLERSSSLQASVPGCGKEPVKSDTPLSVEDVGKPSPSPEQKSSGEQVEEEHIEREEWWESSPGLDVLVDNGLEGYKDDHEYVPVLLRREYEDSVGYDPIEYPGAELMYVSGIRKVYVDLDEERMFDYAFGAAKHLIDRDVDHVPVRERETMPRKVEVKGRNGMDLRDELRKRKRLEGYQPYRNPRRYGPTSLEMKGEEHARLHHMRNHPHHRRLASLVSHRTVGYGSQNDRGISCVDRQSLPSLSETRRSNSRQHENENRRRPHFLPSKVSTRVPMRGRPDATTPGLFAGPKSLAQIKEEKMKPVETGRGESLRSKTHQVSRTRTLVGDFEGPKPLTEILKEKNKPGSVSDISSSPRLQQNHHCVGDERRDDEQNHHCGGDERRDDEFLEKNWIESVIEEDEEDGYEDYYDGDDCTFEEKLASIYTLEQQVV